MSVEAEQPTPAQRGCPVSHDFDPFSEEFHVNPGRAMFDEGPVFYSEVIDRYVVTRIEDVRAIYGDSEHFSSSIFNEPITPICPAAQAKLEEHGFGPMRTFGMMDEPEHLVFRRKMAEPFKAKNTQEWEPRVREVMSGYVDRFVKRGHAELVSEMFWEAPAIIGVEFMGVPEEDVDKVKHYAAGLMMFIFGHPTEEEQVAVCDTLGQSQNYSRSLFRRMKEHPEGRGVLHREMQVHLEDPEQFDEDLIVGLGVNTLAAAHETTTSTLSNAAGTLLTHLDSWNEICADPSLIPNALEECMRVDPSLISGRRLCIKDVEIGGVKIPAGAKVILGAASANVDPSVFENPDEFDIRRKNARAHVLFAYANRSCLGAPLARLQMKVAIEELTRRLPHMRLDPDHKLEYTLTSNLHALTALHVRWDPSQNALAEDRP